MILTKSQIGKERELGNITLNPFNKSQVNPNSYNYRLCRFLKESTDSSGKGINFKTIDLTDFPEGYIIMPGKFYLEAISKIDLNV